jgi:acetoin utilization deacetylase AcuC-like enzyme
MKIFYSSECLTYNQPGHPESPERIRSTSEFLKEQGFSFVEPQPCEEEDILLVHTNEHLNNIKENHFFDSDTPALPNIFNHALLAAGSAILSAKTAIQEDSAFSLIRPPGHHATRNRIMGFCYLNNIAIAASKYIKNHPEKKAAILDIDCHHGNGTEDIFLGNPSVLYVSLHQSPLYPGTGRESHDNCLNFPLPSGTSETEYLSTLNSACEKISEFNPSLIGISAGFDTYKGDPLTQFNLDKTTYKKIGEIISNLSKPLFIIMEGGYSRDLPQCVFEFLKGLE